MPKSPLRIFNPDTEDFTVNYAKKPYTVKSGEHSDEFPQHIALHIAKHLTDKIMHKKGIPAHREPQRTDVLSTILV